MELKGLKVNFLGDSITEGCGTSGADKCFASRIAADYGVISRNYGKCGTRIAPQHKPYMIPEFDRDYILRAKEMDADADVVFVFGGTNDYGHGDAPFGKYGDTSPETFCGACYTLMKDLVEKYIGKKVYIITPLHRADEEQPKTDCVTGETLVLKDYVKIIRKYAKFFSLPVLDFWSESGLQPQLQIIRDKFVPDGLHPNDDGHIILEDLIVKYLLAH